MSSMPLLLNVDDTEGARYAKNRTLRHAGYEVVDAACGTDALALTEQLRPALVVLDIYMPDMSGIEVCKIIKQRWPGTMVLQTSATYITPSDRIRGLEGGADAYLIEPIEPEELIATVRALLRLHSAEEGTRQAQRLAGAPHRRAHARPARRQRAADSADRAARACRGRAGAVAEDGSGGPAHRGRSRTTSTTSSPR